MDFYRRTLNRACPVDDLCFDCSVVESPSTPSTKDNEGMYMPLSATDLQGPNELEASSSTINSDFASVTVTIPTSFLNILLLIRQNGSL